ncbi:MAG: M23 family metallopeptidase [Ignavibacteriaceae bacterium]|jgi:murein DD-endopeptidase MepM/ murein hydrolase activator NlpD|nr:M23 family metallopeptidase [Ignavibacteriaceae bacterium]MCW8813346.1 M23 family metallopeptidase [Chlorobium sp.]MCW8824756.1 M23 family metallopeptidase [Ignavibacteriaceae bacterium]MCW8995627.1 M23 family metallopeptidase [Psychromonas sp.]MCW9097282.1 M23 family metallopeptidase [Ignavibacteriaceae bacterium]
MPLFKYLKNLKSFSVVIVPDDASHDARSKKFTPVRILFIAIIYTVFITVFGYYFLILTGIGNKFLPGKYVQTAEEVENIKELNQKMIFLAKELQILKSTNLRLKYALVLGDSTLADTLNVPEDSLKKFYKNPKEGNLLGVIFEYINYLFHQDDNSIFFILPVNGYISRGFDPDRGHFGIDIVAKVGTPVFASAGGFVVFSSYTNDYGHVLILSHSDGYLSFYKHCSVLLKRDREFVKQGELIAQTGNSGLATTGPHLHFEIWHNGKAVDPETILIKDK